MRQRTYTDGGKTYTRISKAKARAAYNAGLAVVLCPVDRFTGEPCNPENAGAIQEYDDREGAQV
jgi:hypothetical protein